MRLLFLGSGGSAVSAKRACPSILIDGTTVFDIGPGALGNLRKSGTNLDHISDVYISHCHADHVSDLIPFLWAVEIDGRKAPLNLRGPPGFKQVFERFRECTNTPSVFFTFPLTVDEIQFGKRIGNIETCRTDHSIPTLAFRISDGGKSICYSADTIYCPEVVEFAKNADLLVHEATFLGDQESIAELTRHSTAKMAGIVGKETKAKRLALFHIPPPNDRRESEFRSEAGDEYGRDVTIGTDLAEIII